MAELEQFEAQIQGAMKVDRFDLKRTLQRILRRQAEKKPFDRELAQFEQRLLESTERVATRKDSLPAITFPDDLPIVGKLDEIREVIDRHQVVIICGETGSGKSTQLPKLCWDMGLAIDGMIGHTQPRRIAARSIAARLVAEVPTRIPAAIGFKIRFTDETKPTTAVKLMTDGILLAETQYDRFLDQYNVIIIDEAHERSLNIDFLLGYIKRILPKRPDLKLIITSATIDAERFQAHFETDSRPVPILEVSGRGYPVDILYRPWSEDDEADESGDRDLFDAVTEAVDEGIEAGAGDGLIFFPTEQEIRAAAKRLRGHVLRNPRLAKTEILPLYARLPTQEQNRVFESHNHRRIVLATNVAESSLTVPGIRFVIDTGTARISRYAPRSKVQRLPIESISRASADQRAGRCGRIGPGICIRLYSEEDYLSRDAYTTPEIRRTNLASVILSAKSLKLGSIDEFPFIDPPHPESIRDGYRTLFELSALDERRDLTKLGKRLSRLPVDPRVGRMILAADEQDCLADMLIIASGLEAQDPRDRPPDRQQQADEAHAQFQDPESDFISLIKVWDFFHKLKEELSQNRLRKACKQNFLSYQRMRQWLDIHRQLMRLAKDAGLKMRGRKNEYEPIHRALLTGLLSGVAMKTDRHEYLGARGITFVLWPGSGVFKAKPQWLVVSEIVETSRRFGRTVAKIDPGWIEPHAKHVVKRSYSDPHWHRKTERCVAFEKVTLFGLPVVARRRVGYAKIDPDLSRRLFIESGLVGGEYEGNHDFLAHNRLLVEEIERMRDQTRQRDFVIDDYRLMEFYEMRLPEDALDGASLRGALKAEGKKLDQALTMTQSDLIEIDEDELANEEGFPAQLETGGMTLPLSYRFEPGDVEDGVTLEVPSAALPQLDANRVGWLVPGLLEERVVALIRSLPKRIRRTLTPAPETAKTVIQSMEFGKGDFLKTVADELTRFAGEKIPIEEFRPDKLPQHLRMNIRVIDEASETIATGRDLESLRGEVGAEASDDMAAVEDPRWNQTGFTEWSFDDLPEKIMARIGGHDVPGFPALVDEGETVGLKLLNAKPVALKCTQRGMMRLFALRCRKDLKSQVNWLPGMEKIRLWASTRLSPSALNLEVGDLIALLAISSQKPLPRTQAAWEAFIDSRIEKISIATQDVANALPKLFENYHAAQVALEGLNRGRFGDAAGEIKRQINAMIYPGFLIDTPWEWIEQMPRYFQAIEHRIEKLPQLGAKDAEYRNEVGQFWQRYQDFLEMEPSTRHADPQLTEYRWMIEEYRVSLYAQQLGTYISVSPIRLEKQWKKIERS